MTKKTYKDKLINPLWGIKSGIYRLNVNDRFYVGSAVNLKKRLGSHINELLSNKHRNIHLQRAFNKYEIIDFEILEFVPVELLIIREQYFIDKLKPSLNISPIAGSQFGFRHSEKSKKLIGEIGKGRIASLETRKRMSIAKTGIKFTDEWKSNLSKSKTGDKNPFYKAGKNHPQYGTKKSPETIEKLSGKNNSMSKSGVLYDVTTGKNYIFFCLKTVCKKLNLEYRGVLSALRAERFYKGRYYTNFVIIPSKSNE